MTDAIFTNWKTEHTAKWQTEALNLKHRLHQHPLFSFEALADLIDGYPREHYALVEMGPQGSPRRLWREGDLGGMPGRHVIDAIQNGRMWLNMRNVAHVSKPYGDLLKEIFDEIAVRVPGYDTFEHTSGILISSPNAQVYYHCDLPGQSLWQIHGKKRVYVYPNTAPFLTPEQLENIALFAVEVDMRYDPDFDRHAQSFRDRRRRYAALAAERAASRRESRLPQRFDDHGVLDRGDPPPPHDQHGQRHPAPQAGGDAAELGDVGPRLLGQGGAAGRRPARRIAAEGPQVAPTDRIPAWTRRTPAVSSTSPKRRNDARLRGARRSSRA